MTEFFLCKKPADEKHKRMDVLDLKNNHPARFGRFVMALKNLVDSDDWYRICGIHGNTFKPDDPDVKCPTDPQIVKVICETGEPVYCKHKVYSFIAWHTPYLYQYELLLNKYNKSKNTEYITLPYLDLTRYSNDEDVFSFLNDPNITIEYDGEKVTLENPLCNSYYYVDGVKTKVTREGFLTPKTKKDRQQIATIKKQLNNALHAPTYEKFSSVPVTYIKMSTPSTYTPLETPHNTVHDIVGGKSGNMAEISISAFDPIFWLHHCNMDRHFYTWLHSNTNGFKKSIYPDKITDTSYGFTMAPFFKTDIYNKDPANYKYGWKNNGSTYMILKDMLNIPNYPYKYDLIKPEKYVEVKAFVELIDIPIPRETLTLMIYIHPTSETLNKELHFAGSASWFGLNRYKKSCDRCEVTRTNIQVDIDDYVAQNKITKDNMNDFTVVIEGEGKFKKDDASATGYQIYTEKELVQDGIIKFIVS